MHRLFISDLHLSEETPEIEAAFKTLLENQDNLDSLVILGDFFEAWVGDDDDTDFVIRMRALLASCSERGCELMIARGNRDFMLGERFARDTGATLLDDETVVEVGGEPTLLLHGDTLCTDDVHYQQFRRLVHDAAWQAEMMAKPLDERRTLARQLRATSIDAASNKAEDIMDVNQDAVRERLTEMGVRRMIHGHTHRPNRHAIGNAERIVLGDWTACHGWFLRERDEELSLECFDII